MFMVGPLVVLLVDADAGTARSLARQAVSVDAVFLVEVVMVGSMMLVERTASGAFKISSHPSLVGL